METKGGLYITQIKQVSGRIFDRLLQKNGIEINGGQGRILFLLWKQDHLTMTEISRQTALAKNTITVVIDGMVKKGIVLRKQNPRNRREIIISLTEQARALQDKYELVSQQMNAMFYKGFSLGEQQQFEAYLLRILTTLTKIEDNGDMNEKENAT